MGDGLAPIPSNLVAPNVHQQGYGLVMFPGEERIPTFDTEAIPIVESQSEEDVLAGKEPRVTYEVHDVAKIRADDKNEIVHRVDEGLLRRWQREGKLGSIRAYHAWKNGQVDLEGFPIKEWPMLTKAEVTIFQHLDVHTIEKFIQMTDDEVTAMRIPRAHELKQAGKRFLDNSVQTAKAMKEAAKIGELEDQNKNLSAQLENLTKLVAKLSEDREEKSKAKAKTKSKDEGDK